MELREAKRVLEMLDRINREIDLLGNILVPKKTKPVPVMAKHRDRFKFH